MIISGIIFDPIKNEMFYAEKNNGAYFNNQRIRVSKKNEINKQFNFCRYKIYLIKTKLD